MSTVVAAWSNNQFGITSPMAGEILKAHAGKTGADVDLRCRKLPSSGLRVGRHVV